MSVKGTYGAGKTYDFDDVCRIGAALEANEMKLSALKPSHPDHVPLVHNVPYSTMKEWMMDDNKWMQMKYGRTGKSGIRHWRVEKEMRRRTALKPAGGYRGTGEPIIGTFNEKALFVHLKQQSARGTPVARVALRAPRPAPSRHRRRPTSMPRKRGLGGSSVRLGRSGSPSRSPF